MFLNISAAFYAGSRPTNNKIGVQKPIIKKPAQFQNQFVLLPTPETHGETGSVHPKQSRKSNAKMLILLFYVLKRCFLG